MSPSDADDRPPATAGPPAGTSGSNRVLIVSATTGYQLRAFDEAALRLGVELVYATDRCTQLDDPWRDGAIAIRFHEPSPAVEAIVAATRDRPIAGVVGLGDRPALTAALAAERLGLPWHPPAGVRTAIDKLHTRGRLMAAGLPVPWFTSLRVDAGIASVAARVRFPCVVKPTGLSASRGVIRADDPEALADAIARVRAILSEPDVRRRTEEATDDLVIEGYVDGREYALEGLLDRGRLRVLAVFDKPDPLEGPFFEETIYVTPSSLADADQRRLAGVVAHAALALGLAHGPIHAECRVNRTGVFVLEIAPRPIGGLCARALRFASSAGRELPLEELLLRHAAGRSLDGIGRTPDALGVMMVPVPGPGYFLGVEGVEDARRVEGVLDVVITAKPDQLLRPLPEGSSYVGFIFARAPTPALAAAALRSSHERLRFRLARAPVVTATS